jgi:hypothetical protein
LHIRHQRRVDLFLHRHAIAAFAINRRAHQRKEILQNLSFVVVDKKQYFCTGKTKGNLISAMDMKQGDASRPPLLFVATIYNHF